MTSSEERDHVKPRKKEGKLGSKPGLEGITLEAESRFAEIKGRILTTNTVYKNLQKK